MGILDEGSTPEHDKLRAIADQSQTVGEFLEWLGTQSLLLAQYVPVLDPEVRYSVEEVRLGRFRIVDSMFIGYRHSDFDTQEEAQARVDELEAERQAYAEEHARLMPVRYHIPDLLARFFEIDQDKIEREKRVMLEAIRGWSG